MTVYKNVANRMVVLKGHHPKSEKPAVRHAGRVFEDKRKQRKHL